MESRQPFWVELRPHDACGTDDFVAALVVVRAGAVTDGSIRQTNNARSVTTIAATSYTMRQPPISEMAPLIVRAKRIRRSSPDITVPVIRPRRSSAAKLAAKWDDDLRCCRGESRQNQHGAKHRERGCQPGTQ